MTASLNPLRRASGAAAAGGSGKSDTDLDICTCCATEKPLIEFVMKNGHRRHVCRECERQRFATWRERNRTRFRAMKADWQAKNILKRAAHKAVEVALRKGVLVAKPCERCGTDYGVHAHHDDYTKPLNVIWLCARHHGERHRELRAARREEEAA